MPVSTQLELVLREFEEVNARLAQLDRLSGQEAMLEDLRAHVASSLAALDDFGIELRDQRDEFAAALDWERERYRELFEFAPVAYLITNTAGVVQEANAAAAQLLGLSPMHLLQKPLAAFVELDARAAFRLALGELARSADTREFEARFRSRDGRSFEGGVIVGRMHGGEPTGLLRWLIRDVTARKHAEAEVLRLNAELEARVRQRTREVEEERARLETVIEQMPAGVIIVEPGGELALANRQAEEIWQERFELPRTDTFPEGRAFDREGRPLERHEWPLVRALAAGEVVAGELVGLLRADGSRAVIEVNAAPVRDGRGRIVAVVQTFWDVTARERQEAAEREFITNAAHELQTPLTAIMSAAEVLQAGAKELPEDRDRFLAHIQNECDRLARLMHSLLVLAGAQSADETVTGERLAVKPLLEEVAGRLRPANGVRLQVSCSPRLHAVANRDLAEQAIANLAGNAAKYTSEGAIRLSARRIDRDWVAIEVADTGAGVAAEERERVFERFYRGGERDRTGFGLGLAIATQAARALGGRIELEPDGADGGTTVRLTLPGR
jgi:PAS domain S-box-containing protein